MRHLVPCVLLATLLMGGCAALTQHRVGVRPDGALQPCPPVPRCVFSQAQDPEHRVEPLWLRDRELETWQAVVRVVAAQPRTTLVEVTAHYLRAEVASPWGIYTDDLELLRQPGLRRIELRSAARLGYYDFGVNRERVTDLRGALAQADLLARRHP